MLKKSFAVLVATAVIVGASPALADDSSGLYALVGVGQALDDNSKSQLDSSVVRAGGFGFGSTYSQPTAFKFGLGYQVNKNFAFEGSYGNTTNASYSAIGGNILGSLTATANYPVINVNAVGILPVADQFSLLGKLGFASSKLSGSAAGGGRVVVINGTKSDFTYGLGAKYDFTKSVFLRADVDSYNVGDSSSSKRYNVWMIDIGFKF